MERAGYRRPRVKRQLLAHSEILQPVVSLQYFVSCLALTAKSNIPHEINGLRRPVRSGRDVVGAAQHVGHVECRKEFSVRRGREIEAQSQPNDRVQCRSRRNGYRDSSGRLRARRTGDVLMERVGEWMSRADAVHGRVCEPDRERRIQSLSVNRRALIGDVVVTPLVPDEVDMQHSRVHRRGASNIEPGASNGGDLTGQSQVGLQHLIGRNRCRVRRDDHGRLD